MTDTALTPIDTTPLAFEAHPTGAVVRTSDKGVKVAIRSKSEISKEEYLRLCDLAGEKQMCYFVLVPDAQTPEDVVIPPKPETPANGKRQLSASQRQRLKLEEIAKERGATTPQSVEEFYQERMAMNLQKLQSELDGLREVR